MSAGTSAVTRRALLAAGVAAPLAGLVGTARRAHAQGYPTFDLKRDFGAVGDGVADDTPAFQRAAWAIARTPEKGGVLTIPYGTYRVGRQLPADELDAWIEAQSPYIDPVDLRADLVESFGTATAMRAWRIGLPIFHIGSRVALRHLEIRGNGATVRLTEGLLYGGYVPATGHAEDEVPGAPRDELRATSPTGRERANYGVEAGRMIQVIGGHDITVSDLVLDGRSSTLRLGGQYGDTGRQLKANGLRLLRNTNVTLKNLHTHHHGLDGITIGYGGRQATDPATPHALVDVRSEHNGRQALSWTGGRGLTAVNCSFSHTGRAVNDGGGEDVGLPLASKPGAGVDVEPEGGGQCLDGTFVNCRFDDNWGPGILTTSQQRPVVTNIGNISFTQCHIWGSDNWAIYSGSPGLRYRNCDLHGSVALRPGRGLTPDTAHHFLTCTFDDVSPDPTNPKVFIEGRDEGLKVDVRHLVHADMPHLTLADCTIRARRTGSIWGTEPSARNLTNCTIHHDYDGSLERSELCELRGWTIRHTQFFENITAAGSWPIIADGVTVGDPGTWVEGDHVLWNGQLSGAIPAGQYPSS